MPGIGRIAITLTFLSGALLFAILSFLSKSIVYPEGAMAASPSTIMDSNNHSDTDLGKIVSRNESYGECSISQDYSAKILQWCELITYYGQKNGIEPDLLAALILQESGGNPQVTSHSGAVGLMQVMPRDGLAASFMCKNGPCFANRPRSAQLKDPEFNISYGSQMLAGLYKKYGNMREALKSYGPMDVGYSYSDKVLSIYKRYRSD